MNDENKQPDEWEEWLAFVRRVLGTATAMQADFDGILADRKAVERAFDEESKEGESK